MQIQWDIGFASMSVDVYLCVFPGAENGDDSSSDESTPSPATEGR